MNRSIKGVIALLILTSSPAALSIQAQQPAPPKPHRVIVLTDIEADPDDSQSLIRLLLYANQINIRGIVATTSVHQPEKVVPETLNRIIDAYGQVQPNLLLHEGGYPTAETLHARVTEGLPVSGMLGVGAGKDSEGSEWIIRELEQDDDRPLWISVWGGPNTLAQALWKIRETRNAAEAGRLIRKLRVYTISDQDDSGHWMRDTFPELFFIVSPGSYGNSTWSAITGREPGANNDVVSNEWLAEHLQQGHGPLGAEFPDVAYGLEGDTPAFLSLIPNGLNDPERPNIGGWGGRYELYQPEPPGAPANPRMAARFFFAPETRPIWTNAVDTFRPRIPSRWGRAIRADSVEYSNNKVSLWRWRGDFQHDFAARMDWTVMAYEDANHPPVPALGHPDTLTVRSGEIFGLNAAGTTDPDGDALSYWWFQYPEAGTYREAISFAPLSENLYFVHTIRAPEVQEPETAHFILRVTDKGTPALSRYRRVVVNIVPR
ncbi:MAG: DUF1593 domain-containing protein [Rhodothermales bacterium]|nr:DUF1593 domain-containing protein [Rhodothermales bacterium]